MDLIGRDEELRTLRARLGATRAGGALVIKGDPGIGKTSLLRFAEQEADTLGFDVLRTTGVEAEARLPYAGLHEILRPVMSTAGMLSPALRTALWSALGVESGPPPEPFMIALAALNLLMETATKRPVLVAVDNVQWLDHPTQEALAFILRRVSRDPVIVVASLRTGHAGPLAAAGLPELEVGPLGTEASRMVVASAAGDRRRRAGVLRARGRRVAASGQACGADPGAHPVLVVRAVPRPLGHHSYRVGRGVPAGGRDAAAWLGGDRPP